MLPKEQNSSQSGGVGSNVYMVPGFQCLVSFVLRGSGKNDHKFRFLGNIELYERPLKYINITSENILKNHKKVQLQTNNIYTEHTQFYS